ncbi:MAG: serpin family protein [Pseudanabaenales cyanobacterium]|nr:serpin family protein [Pseudanabaenales cyanobacterium]
MDQNTIKCLRPILIGWILLLGLWGCTSDVRQSASIDVLVGAAPEETLTVVQPSDLAIDPRLVETQTQFGLNLFAAILQVEGDQNILISPVSVAIALSMVYNGADGDTQQAIAQTLALPSLSPEAVNAAIASLSNTLATPDPEVRVDIANSLWVRQGFSLYPAFVEQVTEFYNAEATNLDFGNPSAPGIINAWVAEKTEGKISQMVNQISPDQVLFVINAVYFKGNWTNAFDPERTTEQPFHLLNGSTKPHLQMSQEDQYLYYETDQFQAVSLPYGDGGLSLYVFLPKQHSSLADFQSSLSAEAWSDWMTQFGRRPGAIKLPRFQFEYETGLKPILETLGMGIAFDPTRANFAKLSPDSTFISQVQHKTFIEVNEEGTEAAGSTSIGMTVTSVSPEPEPAFEMIVDQPFFIAIRDNSTGAILFMGAIVEP